MVARGRYVEIATVAYTDRYLDMVFGEIGASPPARRFVRYEWVEPTNDDGIGGGRARRDRDSTVITSNRLLNEHELAHAVHHQALPKSRPMLHEGFAVLFDSHTGIGQDRWTAGEPLDPLLEDGSLDRSGYPKAWFLVSQIVRDHGMEGLRDLWRRVTPDASAAEVRTAYQALFGRPIDALIEPYEVSEGGPLLDRWSCYFTVCGEPTPWNGNTWQAEGPFACEDDPDALGPMDVVGTGPVERYHVVELEAVTPYRFTASGGVGAHVRPCGLQCQPRGSPANSYWPDMPGSRSDLPGGHYRVEILADLDELPTDTPGTLTIERLD